MGPTRGLGGAGEDENRDNSNQDTIQRLLFARCLFKDKSWLHSAQLENGIRKFVREEAENTVQRFYLSNSRPFQSRIDPSEFRLFKLQFEGKLPPTVFTGNKVEADEGRAPVKILLLDAVSGKPIKDGPLSSKKIEIVVLHGHFNSEEWTKSEFCSHVVAKRDNKGSLLVGQCVIALHNGVGFIDEVYFTDNSSWVRSKKFRLGARVVASEGDQVREAVSSAFKVKDRRGENYQKHDIPSPEDAVWRLCGIAKDGIICKRLEENHIFTVKDFITQYQNDESFLRSIVKDSRKRWKEIIQHATSCFSGNDAYTSTNLDNLNQINIHIASTSNACSNLQQDWENDQQIHQMSESHGGEHNHQQVDQSMAAFDNSLLESSLIGSPNGVCHPSLGYSTMLNGLTSSWLADQFMSEPSIGMLSSVLSVDVNTSEGGRGRERDREPRNWYGGH